MVGRGDVDLDVLDTHTYYCKVSLFSVLRVYNTAPSLVGALSCAIWYCRFS